MERKDPLSFYKRLGVPPDADQAAISRAYKAAALSCHPDKAPKGQEEEFKLEFQSLTEAYFVLRDPHRRVEYDRRARMKVCQGNSNRGLNQSEGGGAEWSYMDYWEDFYSGVGIGCAGLSMIGLVAIGAPEWGDYIQKTISNVIVSWTRGPRGQNSLARSLGVAVCPIAGPLLLIAYAGQGAVYLADRAVGGLRLHWHPESLCSSSHDARHSDNTWFYFCHSCTVWICSACAYDCHKSHHVGIAAREGRRECGCASGCRRKLVLNERTCRVPNEGDGATEWIEVNVEDPTRPSVEEVDDEYLLIEGPVAE